MKSNDWKINRRKLFHLFFAVMLICCTSVFCHSCTSPEAVYAAETEITDLRHQMVVKGPVFTEVEDAVKPDLTLEQGDVTYYLVSTELTEVPVEGMMTYVSVSVPYELEWKQNPPETTVVTLYDDRTESEYKRELMYLDMKETEVLWEKTFAFPITISGYDADHFQLGNVLVSKDEELILYADQILESMGLSEDHYRINAIMWNGEPYEREGEVFREALAEGEKQIRRVEVTYGGEIKTPDTVGYQFSSIYEIVEEEERNNNKEITNEIENAEESSISEQEEGLAEQIQRFLKENITLVTISSLFILCVTGVVYLWWISKKSKKQKSKELT